MEREKGEREREKERETKRHREKKKGRKKEKHRGRLCSTKLILSLKKGRPNSLVKGDPNDT